MAEVARVVLKQVEEGDKGRCHDHTSALEISLSVRSENGALSIKHYFGRRLQTQIETDRATERALRLRQFDSEDKYTVKDKSIFVEVILFVIRLKFYRIRASSKEVLLK